MGTGRLRENSDDRADRVIDFQVRSGEIRRRSQILFPVSVADQCHWRCALLRIRGHEVAADYRLNAEDLQEFRRDAGNHAAGRLRSTGNGGNIRAVFCDRLEAAVLVAEVIEIRIGQTRPCAASVYLEDGHDAAGIGVRQRPQQHSVNDAEDGRGCPNRESQRKNGDRGESWAPAQKPQGMTQIMANNPHSNRLPLNSCRSSCRSLRFLQK